MNYLAILLILTAADPAPTERPDPESRHEAAVRPESETPRYPEAMEVYSCDFEESSDADYDQWPDEWTRRTGKGYPRYLKISIADHDQEPLPPGNRALRCILNGGAVSASSPPVEINSTFSYIAEGFIRTDSLEHDSAYLALTFSDASRKPLETIASVKLTKTRGWQRVQIGPLSPANERAKYATLSVCVVPNQRADIRGTVWFDDLWFGRFPHVTLESNKALHIYDDPSQVVIRCRAAGISAVTPVIDFELLDWLGNSVARQTVSAGPTSSTGTSVAESAEAKRRESLMAARTRPTPLAGSSGLAEWTPPIPDYGFYRVQASIPGRSGSRIERRLHLAVVPPIKRRERGEFGWSLPQGDNPASLDELLSLIGQAGIHWVKYPVWLGASQGEPARGRALTEFINQLETQRIQMVGMLDQPPGEIRELFEVKGKVPIASLFVDPNVWRNAIDPIMSRLSLKVRWWQLGRDDDTSFIDFPNLETRVQEIREHIRRFGQEIELGFSWPAIQQLPKSGNPSPWDFISVICDPEFTQHELRAYLADLPPDTPRHWITMAPLSRHQYSVETRVHDLVSRMLVAKIRGADAIFIQDPFASESGLLADNGQPGELFVPWRTTASFLTGARYLGSIQLPNGSANGLFERDDEAILAVWNDEPAKEKLFLGDDVRQTNVWGVTRQPVVETENGSPVQVLDVGPTPVFVTGLNLAIAKWRLGFRFETERLASVFGRQQSIDFRFTNPFSQGTQGEVILHAPSNWDISPRRSTFRLGPGETLTESVFVRFGSDASSGEQSVRADFHIQSDREYHFTVNGTIQVGLGDVILGLTTHLDDRGNLIVDQHLTNNTDQPVSFNCLLFPPERRRMRKQVFQVGQERATTSYQLPNGQELLGQTLWLRIEEIGGARILNAQVVAEP